MSTKIAALIVFAMAIFTFSTEVTAGQKVVVGRTVAANQQVSMDQNFRIGKRTTQRWQTP